MLKALGVSQSAGNFGSEETLAETLPDMEDETETLPELAKFTAASIRYFLFSLEGSQ